MNPRVLCFRAREKKGKRVGRWFLSVCGKVGKYYFHAKNRTRKTRNWREKNGEFNLFGSTGACAERPHKGGGNVHLTSDGSRSIGRLGPAIQRTKKDFVGIEGVKEREGFPYNRFPLGGGGRGRTTVLIQQKEGADVQRKGY